MKYLCTVKSKICRGRSDLNFYEIFSIHGIPSEILFKMKVRRIYFILEFVYFILIVATPPPSDVTSCPPDVASSAGLVSVLGRFNEYAKNDQQQQNGSHLHGFCKAKSNKYCKFTTILRYLQTIRVW